jgi:hypothetical protein
MTKATTKINRSFNFQLYRPNTYTYIFLDHIGIDKMSVNKISVCKMSLGNMTKDKIFVDKMPQRNGLNEVSQQNDAHTDL